MWCDSRFDSLVEVDAFLRELSCSVHGILVRLVLDHLHPFAALALLMTVFADHVQLADPVLEEEHKQTNKQSQGCYTSCWLSGDAAVLDTRGSLAPKTIESTVQFWGKSAGKKEPLGFVERLRQTAEEEEEG